MIFISIASYRDPLLWWTVEDCYKKAKHPENLRFGIVDQESGPQHLRLERTGFSNQVRYVFLPAIDARGACWARHVAQALYEGEDYFLQIDSHMWFEQDWDEYCINLMKSPVSSNPKKLYSGLPRGFEFVDEVPTHVHGSDDICFGVVKKDDNLKENKACLAFDFVYVRSEFPVPAISVQAGFIFTLGKFCEEIIYDPLLYFCGEEQSIATRAFTNGYELLHPPRIPMLHFYTRKGFLRHWSKEDDELRKIRWWEREEISQKRLCDLLYHGKDLGVYGLGTKKSLGDFAEYSGIDYINRCIKPSDITPPR
jgi:hypothetical protein